MIEMPLRHIIDCYTDFPKHTLKCPKFCLKRDAPDKCLVRSVWHRYSRRGPATLPVNHTRSCRSKPRIALSSYAKIAGQNQQTTCGELTNPGKKWTTLSVSANFRTKDRPTRCIRLEPPPLGRSTIAQEQAALTVIYRRYAARFQ